LSGGSKFTFVKAVIQISNNITDSAKFNDDSTLNLAESLNLRWQELCRLYLPVIPKNSIWRYSRLREPADAQQGWKLHISATILTASAVFEAVAPFLKNHHAYYKAPVSLKELKKINSGVHYDYTQIGKFITVYPQNDEQAVYFAGQLHRMTDRIPAPSVPYDLKFAPGSCVHYRYGSFRANEIKHSDGTFEMAMRDPQGKLIPDLRDCEKPYPDWISNPFPVEKENTAANDFPLRNFKIFRALAQRGKGGVYQGVDLGSAAPRLCLIKEGRKNGEVNWDGRDGYWRVEHEERVLKALRTAGVNVPQIYSSFSSGKNYYLATEFITGENLHLFLRKRKRRLSLTRAVEYAAELSEIVARIHSAGWVWRDCKPSNLIVTKKGDLRPLDFEGACPIDQPDPVLWSTLTVKCPELYGNFFKNSAVTADFYALGAMIYLLFEGELPAVTEDFVPQILRRNVPFEIARLTSRLLDPRQAQSLKAEAVTQTLKDVLKVIKR
jgi:hypothetical protein